MLPNVSKPSVMMSTEPPLTPFPELLDAPAVLSNPLMVVSPVVLIEMFLPPVMIEVAIKLSASKLTSLARVTAPP